MAAAAEGAGFRRVHSGDTFLQFEPEMGMPVDLILVSDATFEQIWTRGEERTVAGIPMRVVALDHLLALKLHALKQQLAHRTFKDADEVETLLRLNKIDLSARHYEEPFLKYGTEKSPKRSSASSDPKESKIFELDLPDWNGVDRTPPRLSMDDYYRWCLKLWQSRSMEGRTEEERRAARIEKEFIL